MLLAMVVITVVLILGSAILTITKNTKARTTMNRDQIQVYYIAEAGVEMVLARLKEDFNWQEWQQEFSSTISFAGGELEIERVRTIRKTEDELTVEITSVGRYKYFKKSLKVKAKLQRDEENNVTTNIISWKELYGVF